MLTPKQATLKVDDYTHISVSNQGEAVDLTANETTLTKPKGTYARLEITAADEYLLSSVKVAGVEKLSTPNVDSWNTYWDDFSDGAIIEVATVDRPAKVHYSNIEADPEFIIVSILTKKSQLPMSAVSRLLSFLLSPRTKMSRSTPRKAMLSKVFAMRTALTTNT